MSIQHIALNSLTEANLQQLVDNQHPESKHLEYKRDLCIVTDEQKLEILCDISAMANTGGGDIIYGLGEDAGLVGLKKFNKDESKRRIENLLRDFVDPRLRGVDFQVVDLDSGKHALIVRIRQSLSAPHMVRHKGQTRFCGRNAAGKYDLDVQELRSAFLDNETFGERLKEFRLDRINKLASGSWPTPMTCKHLVVLHILPVSGTHRDNFYSTEDLKGINHSENLRPMGARGWGLRHNFDGVICLSGAIGEKTPSYVQVFRQGYIESVCSSILDPEWNGVRVGKPEALFIPNIHFENEVIESFDRSLKALQDLNASPPYVVSLSLLHVRDFRMLLGPNYFDEGQNIDRDYLLGSEILIEFTDVEGAYALRPLFDQVWNACGYPQSKNYDPDGVRKNVS
ncbi:MAG: ATP-binding protein [Opitutales bacterium]